MEDRFKIKKRKEFKLSYKTKRFLSLLSLIFIYFLFLFFFSPKGTILKEWVIIPPITSKMEIFNNNIIYSSSKTLYNLDSGLSINFPYNIINFKVYNDKIYILSDHLAIVNSSFNIIKEIKKEGFYPHDIYFFKNSFCVRWDGAYNLKIILTSYNINNFKEIKNLSFDKFSFIPYITIFDEGNKILLFQNDGDTILLNFSGEILWQKNIRPNDVIVFDPHGVVNEKTGKIVLYWRSYAYNTNIILVLNMDGEIIRNYEIKNNINELFLDDNNIYLITNDGVKIITNNAIHKESIPFYIPVDSFFINDNFIIVWKFKNFISNYKLIKVNDKKIIFNGNLKDILINQNKLYILINSKIYNINLYD